MFIQYRQKIQNKCLINYDQFNYYMKVIRNTQVVQFDAL